MSERISGRGQIERQGDVVCQVTYQLTLHDEADEERFTLTDGIIEVEQPEGSDEVIELEPNEEVTLRLEEPLRDGRDILTLAIEPYEGHRPDERFQVQIK
jgi:hypothetical protein